MLIIVKLKEPKIVPDYIEPRAWFGDFIFTSDVDEETLDRLWGDELIASIERSKTLPIIK